MLSRGKGDIYTKCAWRLLPLIVLAWVVSAIDRVNVGFAALTMNSDLKFTPAIYGFAAGIFFLGYCTSQVPANAMLTRIGARRWLFCMMATWGALSAGTAFVKQPTGFYVLRFFLGVAEGGFIPGILLYLTYWFPQSYRARFVASTMAGGPLSFVIGGPLSSIILQMEGLYGLHGWQWLFLVEGLPACALAFVILGVLPDRPMQASWLSHSEKNAIAIRLAAEDLARPRGFWVALRDPRVLAFGLVLMINESGGYSVRLWLPQIVHAMGYSTFAVGFVVAGLNLIAIPAMIFWGRSSDAKRERNWHAALAPLLASSGFVIGSLAQSNLVTLAALAVVTVSVLLVHGPLQGLVTSFLSGPAAASGLAIIGSIGGLGGFLGPVVIGVFKQQTGDYSSGMMVLALALLTEAIMILALGRAIQQENLSLQPQASNS